MGPFLSQPNKEKSLEEGTQVNKLSWNSCAMQGWRNNMEDAHIHETDIDGRGTSVFGVFDGHGGKEVAEYCSRHFVKELKLFDEFKSRDFGVALSKCFYRMDDLLKTPEGAIELNEILNPKSDDNQTIRTNSTYTGSAGCTANVVLISDNKIYCANAGDSRSVLGQINDLVYALSEDHKPDDPLEKKRITDAGGFVSQGRTCGNLSLSRAIGDFEYKEQKDRDRDSQYIICKPEVREKILDKNDKFILIGCDGIWETRSNEELVVFCSRKLADPQIAKNQILQDLFEEIIAKNVSEGVGCDNMSSILIQLVNQ